MRWVGDCVYRQTLPPVPTLATTAFGIVEPCVKLRFEAVGRGDPHGQTVT